MKTELSDHKLFCFDMISTFLWLTNALSFGFLPSAILQTMNELVSVQLKTSEANKLLVISIIVLTFVDLELEGRYWKEAGINSNRRRCDVKVSALVSPHSQVAVGRWTGFWTARSSRGQLALTGPFSHKVIIINAHILPVKNRQTRMSHVSY